MGNRNLIFCVLSVTILAFGCKSAKKHRKVELAKVDSASSPTENKKQDGIFRKDWNFLSGKAGVDFNDGVQDISATINFRMKKDSIVWILATYLGFEVARVKIDSDSAYVMNRAAGSYYVFGLSELHNYLGVDVTLRQFQNILIANPVLDTFTYDLLPSAPNKLFVQSDSQIKNTLSVLPEGMFIFESILQPLKTATQKLNVDYKEYSNEGGLLMPRKVNFLAFSNEKIIKINLDIKSINVSPIDAFPFTIPSSYERKN